MAFVRLSDVSFSYLASVPILSGVSFQLTGGWTGVVGANGAGKSTLLALLAGELAPSGGSIKFDPPCPRLLLCHQTVERLTAEITAFAASGEGAARGILGRLGLHAPDLARWQTLSPGERKRWQLGAALAAEPAVLMLDEPTDHLDSDARQLMIAGLGRYRGVGIVVSHDRTLLEKLTSHTVRVHEGGVQLWRGSYGVAKRSWEAEEREHLEAYQTLKNQQRILSRRLADKRRTSALTEAKIRKANRARDIRDHDSRSTAREASAAISRQISTLRKRTELCSRQLETFTFRKPPGGALFVDYVRAPTPRLFDLDLAELRAGEKVILEDLHLVVSRDSRIRVTGPNGIGKTTLLRALIANANLPPERLLYLPQELHVQEAIALLDSVHALGAEQRGRVLTIVATLGVDPDLLLASRCPSPGEARKLKIAYGLGRQVWCLMLDEPANHLDLSAIERLEQALASYPGALLMVTHDEALARRCTSTEWRVSHGRVFVRSI